MAGIARRIERGSVGTRPTIATPRGGRARLLGRPVENDNATMETEPKRERRWYQLSLRTLMILVAVVAVPCAYVGWQAKIVSTRRRMASAANAGITGSGWKRSSSAPSLFTEFPSWIRWQLGDKQYDHFSFFDWTTDNTISEYQSAFPEALVIRDSDPRSTASQWRAAQQGK
jgi:hypothetical protein